VRQGRFTFVQVSRQPYRRNHSRSIPDPHGSGPRRSTRIQACDASLPTSPAFPRPPRRHQPHPLQGETVETPDADRSSISQTSRCFLPGVEHDRCRRRQRQAYLARGGRKLGCGSGKKNKGKGLVRFDIGGASKFIGACIKTGPDEIYQPGSQAGFKSGAAPPPPPSRPPSPPARRKRAARWLEKIAGRRPPPHPPPPPLGEHAGSC